MKCSDTIVYSTYFPYDEHGVIIQQTIGGIEMIRKFATYTCWGILTVFAMVLTVISPLLGKISETYSMTMAQSGIIFTINFAGFVAFILIGGVLADRWGLKKILSLSLICFSVTLFLFPMASSFYTAAIIIFFMGGFGGIIESNISVLVTELNPDNPTFFLNLTHVFFGVGALISPVAAGVMISSGMHWQTCYYILGVLSTLFTVTFILLKFPPLRKTEGIDWNSFKNLVTDKKFLLLCLCMIFYTGSEVGGWGWMSTFLKSSMNFSTVKASIAVSVFWAAMTVGRFLCASLTLRFRLGRIIIALAASSSLITVLSGIVSNEFLLWAAIAGMGLTYSGQWALIVSYGSEQYKSGSGTVFALLVGSGGLGTTIIPFVMGVVGERINTRVSTIIPGICLLMIAFIFMGKEKRRSMT